MRLRRGTAAAAWCCGCGVEGVEHGGAWSTEARVAGVMAARARVRRRRRSARAALGEREDARRENGDGGCGSRWERSGRNREGEAGGAGATEIFDRWTAQISLTPVDPTPRV